MQAVTPLLIGAQIGKHVVNLKKMNNNTTTIEEARNLKKELERNISTAIQEFEHKAGVKVVDIGISEATLHYCGKGVNNGVYLKVEV